MKTKSTSETIQFIKERDSDSPGEYGKVFAWKPYLPVLFGEEALELVLHIAMIYSPLDHGHDVLYVLCREYQ